MQMHLKGSQSTARFCHALLCHSNLYVRRNSFFDHVACVTSRSSLPSTSEACASSAPIGRVWDYHDIQKAVHRSILDKECRLPLPPAPLPPRDSQSRARRRRMPVPALRFGQESPADSSDAGEGSQAKIWCESSTADCGVVAVMTGNTETHVDGNADNAEDSHGDSAGFNWMEAGNHPQDAAKPDSTDNTTDEQNAEGTHDKYVSQNGSITESQNLESNGTPSTGDTIGIVASIGSVAPTTSTSPLSRGSVMRSVRVTQNESRSARERTRKYKGVTNERKHWPTSARTSCAHTRKHTAGTAADPVLPAIQIPRSMARAINQYHETAPQHLHSVNLPTSMVFRSPKAALRHDSPPASSKE